MKNEKEQSNFENGDEILLGGWINKKTAMRLLSIRSTTLYYLTKRKEIVSTNVGRAKFYLISSIQDLLNRNKVQ